MSDIIFKALEALVIMVFGWTAGRISVKTKQEVRNDRQEERLKKLEAALPLLLECSFVQLQALKRGKVNGECDEVLGKLDTYLFNK